MAHGDAPIGIRGHDAAADVFANEWRDAELHPIAAVRADHPPGHRRCLTVMPARNRGSLTSHRTLHSRETFGAPANATTVQMTAARSTEGLDRLKGNNKTTSQHRMVVEMPAS